MSTKSKDNATAAGRDRPHIGDVALASENRFLSGLRLELAWFGRLGRLSGRRTGGAGAILRFERVRPRQRAQFQPLRAHEITSKFLDRTIRALKRWKYDIVPIDEACGRAVTPAQPKRFVCLTFDGGYKDVLTSAYPVLSRYGVPFTVYLPTAFPDRLGEAWWLALEQVIAGESRISLVMDRKERHFEIRIHVRQGRALRILSGWMRALAPPDLSFAINDLCKRYSVDLATLSAQAIDGLGGSGKLADDPLVTIGSATVNYPVLANLKDADALREMTMGRAVAQAAFHRDVGHFAYPFGDRAASAGSTSRWRRRPALPARRRRYRAWSTPRAAQFARAAAPVLGRPAALAAGHARAVGQQLSGVRDGCRRRHRAPGRDG